MEIPANRLSTNLFAEVHGEISRLTRAGADIIRLNIGDPDLPPADNILQALTSTSLKTDVHGYQPHKGTEELRQAWSAMYHRVHGVNLDPDGIIPLLGSKEGVFHLSTAILNPGDIVLVPDPGYQTYAQGAYFAGASVVTYRLDPGNDYLPDFTSIPEEAARKAKILWLNYPNNPTGAVANLDFFAEAVEFCRMHGIVLCHDAAYSQVTFDGYRSPSVLEAPGAQDVAVEFNTLSKSHNMAGWRMGVAVGQKDSLEALYKLKTQVDSGHFLPVIMGGVAALTGDQGWLEQRNEVYKTRRDILISGLEVMGFSPFKPKASIYVWTSLPGGWKSEDFVVEALHEAHVVFTPGKIFGSQGDGFIRISLTQPVERIREAMNRVKNWLGK